MKASEDIGRHGRTTLGQNLQGRSSGFESRVPHQPTALRKTRFPKGCFVLERAALRRSAFGANRRVETSRDAVFARPLPGPLLWSPASAFVTPARVPGSVLTALVRTPKHGFLTSTESSLS